MAIRFLIIIWTITSCSGFKHLDRAQEKFSKAAELELNPPPEIPEWPSFYYALSYAHLQKSLHHVSNLKKYGLLSTALTLKALCEWKLNRFEEALETSKEALEIIQNTPRDETLMTALPGLILIEETEMKRKNVFKSPNEKEIFMFLTENIPGRLGFDILELSKSEAFNDTDLLLYINQAGFAGLKVWSDTLNDLNQFIDANSETNELRELFANQYLLYLETKEKLFADLEKISLESPQLPYLKKILL